MLQIHTREPFSPTQIVENILCVRDRVWIIPGQRRVIAQIKAGQTPEAIHGQRGKQRSVHNTYFTLPVIFAMLSNHYSFLYTHPQHWLILFLMMIAGALIRQFFVQRHGYHLGRASNPMPYAVAGIVVIIGVAVWMRPTTAPDPSGLTSVAPPTLADVRAVVESRCLTCHGAQVQMKNIRLDSDSAIEQQALQIHQQVVVTRQMPMNNATGITEAERQLIRRWFESR